MEPLGELTISTHGRGALVSGSVKVVSEGPIAESCAMPCPASGVTGVGASQPVRDALFPVAREGGLDTAAAIRNLTESDLVVTCRLMKDGAVLEETQIPLAATRTGGPVHRRDVHLHRCRRVGLRGIGALYGAARGDNVHRSRRGAGCG